MSRAFPLAGFQAIIVGRFWVFTEVLPADETPYRSGSI
jgi:hypothetical protein